MVSTIAVVQAESDKKPSLKQEIVELPKLSAKQIYVDVHYVAQNPTDIQGFDMNAFGDGAVLGCDFAGRVTEVAEGVTRYKVGDTIAGLIWGGEVKGLGAYSKITIADENISFPVPPSMNPADAATLPLALCTAWLALFSPTLLAISREPQEPTPTLLVWGGSSSVGQYAIQLASLYNFNVVTTCSPNNFDLVKSMGAKHIFDYKAEDVVEQIKKAAPNVTYVFDTIGRKDSSTQGSETIQNDNGALCTVRPGKENTDKVRKGIKVTDVLVWTAFLRKHQYKEFVWPPSQEDHALGTELFAKLPDLLKEGKVKPNKVKQLSGLESVSEGFDLYRDGKISAEKVVYKV